MQQKERQLHISPINAGNCCWEKLATKQKDLSSVAGLKLWHRSPLTIHPIVRLSAVFSFFLAIKSLLLNNKIKPSNNYFWPILWCNSPFVLYPLGGGICVCVCAGSAVEKIGSTTNQPTNLTNQTDSKQTLSFTTHHSICFGFVFGVVGMRGENENGELL